MQFHEKCSRMTEKEERNNFTDWNRGCSESDTYKTRKRKHEKRPRSLRRRRRKRNTYIAIKTQTIYNSMLLLQPPPSPVLRCNDFFQDNFWCCWFFLGCFYYFFSSQFRFWLPVRLPLEPIEGRADTWGTQTLWYGRNKSRLLVYREASIRLLISLLVNPRQWSQVMWRSCCFVNKQRVAPNFLRESRRYSTTRWLQVHRLERERVSERFDKMIERQACCENMLE